MTPKQLRILRAVDLLRWIAWRFAHGKVRSWRVAGARGLGLDDSVMHHWRWGDVTGAVGRRVEEAAKMHGFCSYYDQIDHKRLAHHAIILDSVMKRSVWHSMKISKWKSVTGDTSMPFSTRELGSLLAGLNYPAPSERGVLPRLSEPLPTVQPLGQVPRWSDKFHVREYSEMMSCDTNIDLP